MSSIAALAGLAADNLAQGRPADALRLLDKAPPQYSGERTVIALRAQALYALGDGPGAAGTMAVLAAQMPGEAEAWVALGLLLESIRMVEAAEAAFLRVQAIRPGSPRAANALERLRFEELDEGTKLLHQALAEARLGHEEAAKTGLAAAVAALQPEQGGYWVARAFLGQGTEADFDGQMALAMMREANMLDHAAFDRVGEKSVLHHAIAGLVAAKGMTAFPCYPETFLLPEESPDLAEAELSGTWIVKPLSAGRKLVLTEDPKTLLENPGAPSLLQEYVARPLILNGRKAHLRLYLTLPTADWVRILVHDDGLVQFAPLPFAGAADIVPDDPRHVSTIARHGDHAGIDREAPDGEAWASIWSLRAYLGEIGRQRGVKAAGLAWSNLTRLAREVARLIDHVGILAAERQAPGSWSYPPKIVGIDCLLDEGLKVHFLDLTRCPDFSTGSPAELAVHQRLATSFAELCFSAEAIVPEGFVPLYAPPQA